MRLSEHFTLAEMTKSQTAERLGIDNEPDAGQTQALRVLCLNVLEPIRRRFASPVVVTSGYRCRRLNAAIGGSMSSQHMLGEAADFEVVGVSNLEAARWLQMGEVDFDQLILEFYVRGEPSSGWVHASYRSAGVNRRQCLTAVKGVGYLPGIQE